MDNKETEGSRQEETLRETRDKEPERKVERPPEDRGNDFLAGQTAKEGENLEKKGTFFQDLSKWAKTIGSALSYLLMAGGSIAGISVVGQVPPSPEAGLMCLAVVTAGFLLNKAIRKSGEERGEK